MRRTPKTSRLCFVIITSSAHASTATSVASFMKELLHSPSAYLASLEAHLLTRRRSYAATSKQACALPAPGATLPTAHTNSRETPAVPQVEFQHCRSRHRRPCS